MCVCVLGGGSRLFFQGGLFVVGPESVGAHPGPVCYKKGGMPAITDANAALGRIVPDFFPKARDTHTHTRMHTHTHGLTYACMLEQART